MAGQDGKLDVGLRKGHEVRQHVTGQKQHGRRTARWTPRPQQKPEPTTRSLARKGEPP